MGYFSNGSEGADYEAQYCETCAHYDDGACPVWLIHMVHNYSDCNLPDSPLHMLIPRDKDGNNGKCLMHITLT